ncbi:uncharacterized protein N7479_004460 [Penicillium vulpinum]|uniref:uncharacterized protein n=1 Tax=Penicillium vulpinum TaxID=29845 RepID=UPI00254830AD|nr:uncharacterized protein N7479_004460 [Penicillium vulpinum]KAJ5964584.1 hypothetical protein N7479_004460 [Penicillium vulpinum]
MGQTTLHTSASSRVAVGSSRGRFTQDWRREANAGSGAWHVMTKDPKTNMASAYTNYTQLDTPELE